MTAVEQEGQMGDKVRLYSFSAISNVAAPLLLSYSAVCCTESSPEWVSPGWLSRENPISENAYVKASLLGLAHHLG